MEDFKNLTKEKLFEIAKLIDNGFSNNKESFTVEEKRGYIFLSTNKCDDVSCIRIKKNRIEIICSDTNGWEEIRTATYIRINDLLNTYIKN